MRTAKYDVLITLMAIIRRYKGNWCYASRSKILELLKEHHGIIIGYRQLGNHLADLRDSGLIKSFGRNYRNKNGTICLLTSARCLTIAGCKYLIKRGVLWARGHLGKLKAKYIPKEPKPPSKELPRQEWVQLPRRPGVNPFLDPEFRRRMGLPAELPFDLEPS